MYQNPEVLGVTLVAGAGGGAALAVTGIAFGLYLAIAAALLLVGLVIRQLAMHRS